MSTYKNYGFDPKARDLGGKAVAKIVLESQGYTDVEINMSHHGDDIVAISPDGERLIFDAKSNKNNFQVGVGSGGTKENPIPMKERLSDGWKRAFAFVAHHLNSDKCYIIPTSIIKKTGQRSVSLGGPKWEKYCVGTFASLLGV